MNVIRDLIEDSYIHRIQIGGPVLNNPNKPIAGLYVLGANSRNVFNYLSAYNLKHPGYPNYVAVGLYMDLIRNSHIHMIAVNDFSDAAYVDQPFVGSFINTNINFISLINGLIGFYIKGNSLSISKMIVGCSDTFKTTYGRCATGIIDDAYSAGVKISQLISLNTDPPNQLVKYSEQIIKYSGPWVGDLNTTYYTELKKKNSGIAVLNSGSTRITVNHGLMGTPSKILITPYANIRVWIENITNTSFDIVTDTAPTTDVNIAWFAEI
jgi:hypothetical protein